MVDLLVERGVDRGDITVFASDGPHPGPDLAILDEKPEKNFWLIEGLALGARLRPEVSLVDSRVHRTVLRPATRSAIADWFDHDAAKLEPGSVLLLYVTDHGHKNAGDLNDNSIVLWGEDLSVKELRRLLGKLPPGVRTVMLMSQCFSGSFANVLYGAEHPLRIDGSVCGFFSSPADRFAYGCYPENRGKENVGHSFQFLEALRVTGSFDAAQKAILVTDDTPDVPNDTSSYYVTSLVRSHAGSYGLRYEEFADQLLEKAWGDDVHYADEFARIDDIGRQFGAFGPRTFAELDERTKNLPELRKDLHAYAERWNAALTDLKRANLESFLAQDPRWGEVVERENIEALRPNQRRALRRELLAALGRFTRADPATMSRLRVLRSMARASREGAYRMEVRIAASLRMRGVLGRIAGEVYLDRYASHAERAAYEALRGCEAFELKGSGPMLARLNTTPPFPSLEAEAKLLATVLPGWLGVEFKGVDAARLSSLGVEPGAVTVTRVYAGSPAARAGIVQGDVVLGPPGEHFAQRNEIREWVMTSMIDETRNLEVLREGRVVTFAVRISAPPSSATP